MKKLESKRNRFLGSAPTHIQEKDLVDYFIYTFEFIWNSEEFEQYRDNIKGHFETNLFEFMSTNNNLETEKQWWTLILFALRDLSDSGQFYYASETINYLLKSIQTLSVDDLEEYCNNLNHTFHDVMPEILSIRPGELKNLKSDALETDEALMYYLDNKEQILKLFTKNLRQKDIEESYINQLTVNDKKLNMKFTSFWDVFFEIFVGYSLSMYDFIIENKNNLKEKESIEEVLKKTNSMFLTSSIINKNKIEKINLELIKILVPFYKDILQ